MAAKIEFRLGLVALDEKLATFSATPNIEVEFTMPVADWKVIGRPSEIYVAPSLSSTLGGG